MFDITKYAPAIKETVSGGTTVCKNVSPLKHNLDVRAKSKNLINPEAIVQVYSHTKNFNIYNKAEPLLLPSGTYTFRYLGTDIVHQLDIWNVDTSEKIIMLYNKATYTFTLTQNTNIYITLYNNDGFTEYTKEFYQLEEGSAATAYTPYRTEFEGVEVSRYGKNLFTTENKSSSYSSTIEIIDTNNCIITAQRVKYPCYWGFYIENPKKDFTISFKYLTENTPVLSSGRVNCLYIWGSNTKNYNSSTAKLITSIDTKATDGVQDNLVFKVSAASCVGYKYVYIWWYGYNTSLSEVPESPYKVILSDMQVELNSTVTEYESYKEPQTATATVDGTVEGLTSLSPNMTLLADNNVIIDCTYNKSTKAYIDEKVSALSAALLEV